MQARTILRNQVLNILGAFCKPSPGVHILNGHMISDKMETEANKEHFRELLYTLNKQIDFITIEEATTLISSKQRTNYPLVAFTFDDGFKECHSMIAPIIEEFKINAAFFINPNFVEGNSEYIKGFTTTTVRSPEKKPMRWDEIRDLQSRGHIIGAHTMDHYMVNTDNEEELEYQIGNCKKVIEDKLKISCDFFAFPYGKLEHANSKSIDLACKYYKYVFSQSDYKHYFSFDGRVINRRHFEPFWPIAHVKYFLSCNKI